MGIPIPTATLEYIHTGRYLQVINTTVNRFCNSSKHTSHTMSDICNTSLRWDW